MACSRTFFGSLLRGLMIVVAVLLGAAVLFGVLATVGWMLPSAPVAPVVAAFKMPHTEYAGTTLFALRGFAWWFYAASLAAGALGIARLGGYGKSNTAASASGN